MPTTAPKLAAHLLRTVRRTAAAHHDADAARRRAAAVLGGGVLAGTAFGALAVASARRATVATDNRLHHQLHEELEESAAGDAAEAVAPTVDQAGKWWVYAPVAAAVAAAILLAPGSTRRTRRSRRVAAAAVAAVPALATALSLAFDRWLPQPPVGPRRRPLDHPVFPSGHAFRATAVALTAGYAVVREGLVPPAGAWPVAVGAPVAVGLARLVREKHLASDTVGGWLAGATLAAAAAGAYELARAPRRRPARRRRG